MRAAAAGTVTFSGVVVDVRYVVIRHADGLLATYGGLSSTTLDAGDIVVAGSLVGHSGAGPVLRACAPGLTRTSIRSRCSGSWWCPPYLVPTDGTARRPPPEPVLRCRPI